MVFKKIDICSGTLLRKDVLLQILKNRNEEYKEYEIDDLNSSIEEMNQIYKDIFKNIKCFDYINYNPQPCCSKLSNQFVFIGNLLDIVHRMSSRNMSNKCNECSSHSLCDNCINKTTEGLFPVENIYESVFEISNDNLCKNCYHYFRDLTDICPKCKSSDKVNENYLDKNNIKKSNKYPNVVYKTGFFAFVDDCLTCS